jgi:hypothetical protein
MPRTVPEPRRYRLVDALLGLFVGLWLTVLPGFGLYSMSPETLRCKRAGSQPPECELVRRVGGFPLRVRLGSVRDATVERHDNSPRFIFNRRSAGGPSYRLRYRTASGAVDGWSGPSREPHEAIAGGLNAFLLDPSAPAFEATTGGGPGLWRLALGLLFGLGALCLINIPFATLKALRSRRRTGPAAPGRP